MNTRLLLTAAALLIVLTALPDRTPAAVPHHARRSTATEGTRLSVFGGAGKTRAGRLDSTLTDLARHTGRVRAGHELTDLQAMSPAARFSQARAGEPARVLVDVVTRGDPQKLRTALESLGMTGTAAYANDVGGWLPVSQLATAAARAEVHSVRASLPRTRAGAVTSQGDYAQRSDVVRSTNGLDGTGVTVGVLSDSYNCYQTYAADGVTASGLTGYAYNGFLADAAADMGTGDLPASVRVLEDVDCMSYTQYEPASLPFTDEGRAMLQVVHDVAPGAALAFYTADNSEADFANGIVALANAGARVIADDVGYFDEPFFQDGLIAQAIDQVKAQGVAYFSAAGNDADNAYDNTAPSFPVTATSGAATGEKLLNFDTSGATTTTSLPITITNLYPGEYLALVLEWDQPYVTGAPNSGGATSRLDLCVTGSGSDVIFNLDGEDSSCTGLNALGSDPVQVLIIGNPATATGYTKTENLQVTIGLSSSSTAPGRIKLVLADNAAGSTINAFQTHSATLQGHPAAAGAAAVGAAYYFNTPRCGTTPALLEDYSSQGGSPTLFDSSGQRLSTAVVRQKPDFVAPDGINNTFLGYQLSSSSQPSTSITACRDATASAAIGVYPSFYGTSAAAPHAAGIAALMLQAVSTATPDQIYTALRSTALAMGSTVPDYNAGYGFIQADVALAALGSGSSSSSSSSSSSTSSSSSSSGSSEVVVAASSGGGGGDVGFVTILGLGAFAVRQALRRRRAPAP